MKKRVTLTIRINMPPAQPVRAPQICPVARILCPEEMLVQQNEAEQIVIRSLHEKKI
ncbi:hypothetical protein EDD52_10859 [Primorskyibacter sedentarius]|uniref:Uncharacterized protein n=1 Tax=Primorskyibacter sedentarius TaxID=745311 RepID=A0A4R3JBR8_9RHOB|nr:hypothetical protein EDD52_10859 [Primorskyibacter sedentarius]